MPTTAGVPYAGRRMFYWAAAFGIVASAGYALQHPLTKPVASRLKAGTFQGLWLVVAIEIFGAAVACLLMLYDRSTRGDVRSILTKKANIGNLLLLCAVASATMCLYIFSVSVVDQVFLAAVLNCFPFWSLLIGALFFPDILNRSSIHVAKLLLFAAYLITLLLFGYGSFQRASFWYIPLFSLIPIGYSLAMYLRMRFFGERGVLAYVIATNIFNAPFLVVGALVVLSLRNELDTITILTDHDIFYYLIGGISGFAAQYAIHKGTNFSEQTAWAASLMLFATPSFTFLFSYMLVHYGNFDIPVDPQYARLALLISFYLFLYELLKYWGVNWKKKFRT